MNGAISFTEPQWEAEDLLTDDDFSIAVTDRLSKVLKGIPTEAFSEDTFKNLREITTVIGEYRTLFAEKCERAKEVRKRASQRGMLSLQTINQN